MMKVLCLLWLISICSTEGDNRQPARHHYRHDTNTNRDGRLLHNRKEVAYLSSRHSNDLSWPKSDSFRNVHSSFATPVTTVRPKSPEEYFRQRTSSELYGDEGDLDDWDESDYDEDLQDDAPSDDWEEEDSHQQVETTTYKSPYKRDNYMHDESSTHKTFTQYKWEHFGTRQRVEESRNRHRNSEHFRGMEESKSDVQHVINHFTWLGQKSKCHHPLPRVVKVQDEHPDTSKTYMPPCTVLYRCGPDTGCCIDRNTHCAPKRRTQIILSFFVNTIGSPTQTIQKLTFYNHTECECLPRNGSKMPVTDVASDIQTASRSSRELINKPPADNVLKNSRDTGVQKSPENYIRCKCPREYSPVYTRAGVCMCDCLEGNKDCGNFKRGKEYFSLMDRFCIREKTCSFPSCEYGVYGTPQEGRCPKREEKIATFTRFKPN